MERWDLWANTTNYWRRVLLRFSPLIEYIPDLRRAGKGECDAVTVGNLELFLAQGAGAEPVPAWWLGVASVSRRYMSDQGLRKVKRVESLDSAIGKDAKDYQPPEADSS